MTSTSAHSEGAELGRFLRARRTQTSPEHVGLSVGVGIRRTPGLRREELATLAGISIDYYVRLERGKETRPSPAVLDSLARALHMDDQKHQHLRELAARAARYVSEPPPAPSRTVRPHLKLLLESLRPNPAYVISRSMDMLAWNPGGIALYAGLEDWPAKHRNLARYPFLHPASRTLFTDWDRQITACVARLRAVAGTAPDAVSARRTAKPSSMPTPTSPASRPAASLGPVRTPRRQLVTVIVLTGIPCVGAAA
ncbi:helix-turn-helix transcriptional regulator [Streptomyces fragilis]|uniref:Helix-turn-helix transcriptional regulator n=1 Tax=Streptomyces fragilis TaxID=67301 RepID=A0ABV2YRD3_9ACTN|nr:helix-turn-helix transcriptional regulator [Streptomyces fragilis]